MIDYEKILDFLIENDLEFNEFMLLYTLHLRNLQEYPELYERMDKYYSKRSETICYKDMIDSLEERDFLENFNKSTPYIINRLKISEKFTDLLFIDESSAWNLFYSHYPKEGLSPDGNSTFYSNLIDKDSRDYFKKYVLKNSDKIAFKKIIDTMQEMFGWNGERATGYARVGLNKYLLNFEEIMKNYQENESKKSNWQSTRL